MTQRSRKDCDVGMLIVDEQKTQCSSRTFHPQSLDVKKFNEIGKLGAWVFIFGEHLHFYDLLQIGRHTSIFGIPM